MLHIKRIGGVAGFGGPFGKLRAEGTCRWSDLSAEHQAALDRLFALGTPGVLELAQSTNAVPRGAADIPSYEIVRERDGHSDTVTVPEPLVPEPVRACVHDTLD